METRMLYCLLSASILFAACEVWKTNVIAEKCLASQWTNWSEWSACSRSCGGGIMTQRRSCRSNNCTGETIQYRSCNLQGCQEPNMTFREFQCSKHNERGTVWIPAQENSSCQLCCMSGNVKLTGIAKSGTTCTTAGGKRGKCVESLCVPTGCDGIIGSQLAIDKCLQCSKSLDTVCIKHEAIVNTTYSGFEIIPENATSILVNFTQHLVLSFGSKIKNLSVAQDFTLEGVHFLTQNKGISTIGPLHRPLTILGPQSTVSYEYYQLEDRLDTSPYNGTVVFSWQFSGFSHCSVSCGGTGFKTSHPHCIDMEFSDRVLPDSFCRVGPKPLPIVRKCSSSACPGRWVNEEWSSCSATCGGGNQTRFVTCKQLHQNGQDLRDINAVSCAGTTKPATTRLCNSNPCDARWNVGKWSKCSSDCGVGERTRLIKCVNSTNANLNQSNCDVTTEPVSTQPCNNGPCYYSWHASKWDNCSTGCGKGTRQRTTQCHTHTNRAVDSNHCSRQPRPHMTETCKEYSSCATNWRYAHWSTCQGECCETNYQRRTVDCIALVANELISVPDKYCMDGTKPHTTRICNRTDCPRWVVGKWGQCSVSCGNGEQQRLVKCLLGNLESTLCCHKKPSQFKACVNPECNEPSPVCHDSTDACIELASNETCNAMSNYVRTICCRSCLQFPIP